MEDRHKLSAEDVVRKLQPKDGEFRRGGNVIFPEKKKTPLFYVAKIATPLLLVFAVTAIAAFVANEMLIGWLSFAALGLFAFAWYYAYRRADELFVKGKKRGLTFVRVLRSSALLLVPEEDLSRGDILLLEGGDYIPADCRILSENGCVVRESALFHKKSKRLRKSAVPCDGVYEEADNMLWAGSVLEEGNCRAIVCEVGALTRLASLAVKANGDRLEDSSLFVYLKRLSLITSSVLLGFLFLTAIFAFTPLSRHGLFPDWMLMASLAGTSFCEILTLAATVAYGQALYTAKGFSLRSPEKLTTLAATDHVILTSSAFRKEDDDGVTALWVPRREGGYTEKAIAPMPAEEEERILRNALIALGGIRPPSGEVQSFRSELTLAEGVYQAFRRAELSMREESYALISHAVFEEGSSYGLFRRGEEIFAAIVLPLAELLPFCGYVYVGSRIISLSEDSRQSSVKTPEDPMSCVLGVAIGCLDKLPEVLPITKEALLAALDQTLVLEGGLVFRRAMTELSETLDAFSAQKIALTVLAETKSELTYFAPAAERGATLLLSPSRKELYHYLGHVKARGETVLIEGHTVGDLALMKEADLSFVFGKAPPRKALAPGEHDADLLAFAPSATRRFADSLVKEPMALPKAVAASKAAFYKLYAVLGYLFTQLSMKTVAVIGSLFVKDTLVTPMLLILLGFVFDTLAVFTLTVSKCGQNDSRVSEREITRYLAASAIKGTVFGGILLTLSLLTLGEAFMTVGLFAASFAIFLFRYLNRETATFSLSLGTAVTVGGIITAVLLILSQKGFLSWPLLFLVAMMASFVGMEFLTVGILKKIQKRGKKL